MAFSRTTILLALLWLCGSAPAGEVIRADRSETVREPSGILRIAWGAVSVADSARRVYIAADSAHVWISSDSARAISRARFFGGVSLRDSARQVRAESLVYSPAQEVASFRGRVQVADGSRLLAARHLVYRRSEELMEASGEVGLSYEGEGVRLQAGALDYHAAADSGVAVGGVVAHLIPARGSDTLSVRADTLRFEGRGRRMRFLGNARLAQAGMRASAQEMSYARPEGRLELLRDPSAAWVHASEGKQDSAEIRAERLLFILEGDTLREVQAYRNAEIRMAAPRDTTVETRTVRADTATLAFREGRLSALAAGGRAEARLQAGGGARTELRGMRIRMGFADGALDSLRLEEGEGTYVSADRSAVSRLAGGAISFRFSGGEVRQVLALQTARCEHLAEGGEAGRIRLTGDRVELLFEAGRLQRAGVDGGVRGSYTPGEPEAQP